MKREFLFLLFAISFTSIIWYLLRRSTKDTSSKLSFGDLQQTYHQRKSSDVPLLSDKEKLSLSWEPIRNLTNYIISKFSNTDKNKLFVFGQSLLKYGMKYIHVIDYALPKKDYVRAVEIEKEQEVDTKKISR